MSMIKQFSILLVVACSLAFYLPGKWKTLNTSSFSIDYPPNWELTQNGQMGTHFILMTKAESDKDKFRENINLITQDLKGNEMDLDEYTTISLKQISQMSGSALIENKRIKRNPECHKLIYTANQAGMLLEFEQYLWVIKNEAYVLTFSSEADKFKKYHPTAEQIMDSFKLK